MAYTIYTAPTITGYNATPPSDDGSETANNTVEWDKHIDKIGDPVKNYVDATQTNLAASFAARFLGDRNSQGGAYTVQASDFGKVISCTAGLTLTLLATSTATAGFHFVVENVSTGTITIDGDGSETINGLTTFTIGPGQSMILQSDGTNWRGLPFHPRQNLVATTAPGVTNDVDEWYYPGSHWVDVTGDDAYVCLDSTDGAAVWKKTTSGSSVAVICDQRAQNTDGGTFTLGADRTRDLNTEVSDPDGIVTISTNQFTLPNSGTYMIEWHAPAFRVGFHQSFLYDITGAAELTRGMSATANTTDGASTSIGRYIHTISASNVYEIRHRCSSTQSTDGFGTAGNFGVERYTFVTITQLS